MNHQRHQMGGSTVNDTLAGASLTIASELTARTRKRYEPGARVA